MMLSSEYRILADNNLSTDRTAMELSYALDAFDRLDRNAEAYSADLDGSYPCKPSSQYHDDHTNHTDRDPFNGFFIRDDVPIYNDPYSGPDRDLVQQNLQHFNRPAIPTGASPRYPSPPPYNGFKVTSLSGAAFAGRVKVNGDIQPYGGTWNYSKQRVPTEESHDQMVELYMGTALATRLVDNWATYNGKNLVRQAGDAEFRMVRYGALSFTGGWTVPKWRILNPATSGCAYGIEPDKNCNAGGADISYHGIGATIGLRTSAKGPGSCTDAQINSIYLGTGAPYEAAFQLAQFATIVSNPAPPPFEPPKDMVYACTYNAFADYWRAPGICRQPVWTPTGTIYMPYPCIQNTTLNKIKKFCLKYDNMRYPHVPMVYKIISGPGIGHGNGDIDGSEYTGKTWPMLFSEAPACGCYSYGEYPWQQIDDYGSWWWSGPNWSQDFGKRGSKSTCDYNNLDYMYLYNLYNLNDTKYISYYYNSFYKEKFNVNYPYGPFGSNTLKIGLNFLEYLSLINIHSSGANMTYRGAKAIDLLPGFRADNGSSVNIFVKDYECDKSKSSHYYYASMNGKEITDISGAHVAGKGTDITDFDTSGALDLVPYNINQTNNLDYDPSTITGDEDTTNPDYLAAVQNYKDSLLNIVYESGDSDLIAQVNSMGFTQNANKGTNTKTVNNIAESTIYPNPSTGEFTIFISWEGKYDAHIYNTFGVEVMTDRVDGFSRKKLKLPDSLPPGSYTVVLLSEGKDKIVKKLTLIR